ncbi:MAG TPA: hypothetical protein ENG83_09130 [Nitrospirae bacterium]|nr:hypothetical protein BMS3Abin06_00313 [bacterium BMS3Abin06]HDH12335.1 hypothetical protein [Nitrospirota bacterium]HDZ00374.1 hypothetical protein [Nitrospirota bacterium]
MRSKRIFLTTILAVAFLFLPVIAGADTVPWLSEQYTAIARGESSTDTQYGPPLPVSASEAYNSSGYINEITSTITSSDMNINGYLDYWSEVGASAEFSGTYTATSTNPLFIFTYSLTSVSSDAAVSYWLYVNDLTDGTSLYNSGLSLSNDPISIIVSTTPGNEISVDFGVSADVASHIGAASFDTTLAYSTAVAPEPISSILFIAGGTLLAGRRYFKRNRRA